MSMILLRFNKFSLNFNILIELKSSIEDEEMRYGYNIEMPINEEMPNWWQVKLDIITVDNIRYRLD